MALQIRLDKSQNLIQLKSRIDLSMSLSIRLICKLTKFIIKNNNKIFKPKTYNKIIYNLIHRNRWRKLIYKKL